MKSNLIVRLGVYAALLFVCGLCALTTYGSYAWFNLNLGQVHLFEFADVSVEAIETWSYDARPALVIDSAAGNISITAADVSQIEVETHKTAWGRNDEEATDNAYALEVVVTETDESLTLTFTSEPEVSVASSRGGMDHIDFVIRVPAGTPIQLTATTSFGDVEVRGTSGDADLETQFGNITVSDLAGALTAASSNAEIHLTNVDAGEADVTAETTFGMVEAENISANAITLTTSNGNITASGLEAAADLKLETQFGEINVDGFRAGSLTLDNQTGRIELDNGEVTGRLEAFASFGDIELIHVLAAGYTLSSTNGTIKLDEASGPLTITTSFGSIEVAGAVNATLNLEASNGSITFSGTLNPEAAHTLLTSFGDIRLTIPADSAFDLSLETSFGRITSELPVTLTGTLSQESDQSTWEGTLNGGGQELKATTSNGDIQFIILDPGN